jgi:uncharacterized protein
MQTPSSSHASATTSPWHPGEQQLQAKVGVADRMEAVGSKVIRDYLPEQHREFYQNLPFLLLGAVDAEGWPWATVLEGQPGFVHSPDIRHLQIAAPLQTSDPLAGNLQQGSAVGLLGIELHSRRRNRLNGQVVTLDEQGLAIQVEHSFGNCPQYIQQRHYSVVDADGSQQLPAEKTTSLNEHARRMIEQADTFFVASYVELAEGHRAVDVSHRGGQAGFILVEGNRLTIPDFAGNLHFNTLGNLLLNPRAGLLFIDFSTGDVLQLSGCTQLTLEGAVVQAFQGAERLWHVDVEQVVWRPSALRLRWHFQDYSPNCLMTGNWADTQRRLAANNLRDAWRPMRVTQVVAESHTIKSYCLEPVDGAGLPAYQSGQHLLIRVTIPGQAQPAIRSYSVSSAPSDGYLRLSIKRHGLVSSFLHEQVHEGTLIDVRAPVGQFTLDVEARRPIVLLAAGVGITPLLAMLREHLYQNVRLRRSRQIWLLQSARNVAELPFRSEINVLQQRAKDTLHVVRVLSQPEPNAKQGEDFDFVGRISSELLKAVLPFDDYDFYLCGPSEFTQQLYDGLRALNISDARLLAESFGPSSLIRQADSAASPTSNKHTNTQAATEAVPVLFANSSKEARWLPNSSGSLLELAESRGLQPNFSCRRGSCGACKTKLLSGQVHYPQAPALTTAADEVLLCCAVPAVVSSALVIDL